MTGLNNTNRKKAWYLPNETNFNKRIIRVTIST